MTKKPPHKQASFVEQIIEAKETPVNTTSARKYGFKENQF